MKVKIIVASVLIVAAIVFGAVSFVESNVEYGDFQTAMSTHKKIQIKGMWLQDKESLYDKKNNQFIFYMRDDKGMEMKVVLDGPKPNNFEIADAIVVKGRYKDEYFHATECLTKCPSKYEGGSEMMKKTL